MIRSVLSELAPFLVGVGVIMGAFLYSPFGLPVLVVVGLLYGFYRQLARMEYYLSEAGREAMFWRDRNRFLFNGFKYAGALLLVGALYTNYKQNDRYLAIHQRIDNRLKGLGATALRQLGVDSRMKEMEQTVRQLARDERRKAMSQAGQIASGLGKDVRKLREGIDDVREQAGAPEKRKIPSVTPSKQSTTQPSHTQAPIRPVPAKQTPTAKQPTARKDTQPQPVPPKKKRATGGLPFKVRKTGEN